MTDHNAGATLVTVLTDGTVIDRRRVELVDPDLPRHPHHHEGQELPLKEAVLLVERVRESAERRAREALDQLSSEAPARILALAIRAYPSLPQSVAERITDYRAQNVADSAMYRAALANAAKRRGWVVRWYDQKSVLRDAARVLRVKDADEHLREAGKSVGRPWQKVHRVAMAAAIVAGSEIGKA